MTASTSLSHTAHNGNGLASPQSVLYEIRKNLGAFYTAETIADHIVRWAIRAGSDSVLDPSCGDGVFLGAADARLRNLGCESPRIVGVDFAAGAFRAAQERVPSARVITSDFFRLTPNLFPLFDSVIGNPPFIRYQRFNGNKGSLAHQRAEDAGVHLPRLASSWAPFVIHAAQFLRPGGRLAMVMPAELGHAMYARAVLQFVLARFEDVRIEMFRKKLFGDLNQSTVLLYCDGFGERCRRFAVGSSEEFMSSDRQVADVAPEEAATANFRLVHCMVAPTARGLYRALAADRRVRRLGEIADVGIGYVTGANDFFHLSETERRSAGISLKLLRPAALNLRGLQSPIFSRDHWESKKNNNEKVYLLSLPPVPRGALPKEVREYLQRGEFAGVPERYKCRVRQFWYSVPHVRVGDAFFSYMSGDKPLLAANVAKLVAPNTVHILRFAKGADPMAYATGWRNSLTMLSCELEGHALGGGLLKLEPSEAESVLTVNCPVAQVKQILAPRRVSEHNLIDTDRVLLRDYLGLSENDCVILREAAMSMELWRKHQ